MNLARLAAILALTLASPALAISPGNNVSCSGSPQLSCSPTSNVVQDGAEIDLIGPAFDFVLYADFSQDLLTVTESSSSNLIFLQPDGDFIVSFTNTPETFLYATLLNNNVLGFDASDISLVGGVLSLDLRETFWTSASTFQISFAAPIVGGVPEPATWAMMLLGFGITGGALRISRRKVKPSFATDGPRVGGV